MAFPVQLVLDPSNFIREHIKPAGGNRRDLFEGRDHAFEEHRNRLAAQVRRAAASTSTFQRSAFNVASVTLAAEGLAKTNRPASLLSPRLVPSVGTGRPAELLIQISPESLDRLAQRIDDAETVPPIKERRDPDTGRRAMLPTPSGLRCDVGIIESIKPWSPENRLRFSAVQARRWLAQSQTPTSLTVHLFNYQPGVATVGRREVFAETAALEEYERLNDRLDELGCVTTVSRIGEGEGAATYLLVGFQGDNLDEALSPLDTVLDELAGSFLVRSVSLPARLEQSQSTRTTAASSAEVPQRHHDGNYPIVAIVDGGVGSALMSWVIHTDNLIQPNHGAPTHGAHIGGLLVAGQQLNGPEIAIEPDGCLLVDLCSVPQDDDEDLLRRYYLSYEQFFNELDKAVGRAIRQTGVRVFNFSVNFQEHAPDTDGYTYETRRLDEIALKHDVVFVFSSGNLHHGNMRAEWPADENRAVQVIALSPGGLLQYPAVSLTNVSVAALNPPGVPGFLPHAPAAYSRKGPSAFGGVKPDLAHFGGCAGTNTGLKSFDPTGQVKAIVGTSYATPLVAKSIARYAQEIKGQSSRELLIGLLVHHSAVPKILDTPVLRDVARDMVGFGVPGEVHAALEGGPHSATIVFEQFIPKGRRLEFDFEWPASLVDANGRCRGSGRLTLVARPQIDTNDGFEAVRTQLDGHVLQLGANGKPKGGHFEGAKLPRAFQGKVKLKEGSLIRHALKWSAVKAYSYFSKRGRGETSRWRMTVEAQERKQGDTPEGGTRFVAILTIEDPAGKAPIFDELKASLVREGVRLQDIRAQARARPRAA